MTASDIFNGKILEKIKANPDKAQALNSVFEFDVQGDSAEIWTVDLTKSSDWVYTGSSGQAKVTVTIKLADLADIVEKKLNPQMAFMTGKLKVKGDMGLALKLGSIL